MQPKPLRAQAAWIAGHWRPYRGEILILLTLTVIHAAVIVIHPIILKRIVNGIESDLTFGYLAENVAALVALGMMTFVLYASLQTMRARLNLRFDFGVRMRAFESILRMGPTFFSRFRTGDLVTRLTDDITEKLSWYLCSGIFRLVEAVILILFGVAMMIRLNAELTLYAAGPLPVLIGLWILTGNRLEQRYQRVQRSISELNAALEGCFSGVRVVRAFAAEAAHQETIDAAIARQRREEIRAVRWQTLLDALYGHIWQFAIIGVLLAGGAKAIRGEITLGELIAFDAYVLMLVWPMFDVGQFFVSARLSAVTLSRIAEVEEVTPEVREHDDAAPRVRRPDETLLARSTPEERMRLADTRLPVRFEQVSYHYPQSEQETLVGLDFEARPGSMTAIVGEIGAGKSTALALVARLVDPSAGRILVAGRDLRELAPTEVRNASGYVPQEPLLFSTTLVENIRFGREWISEEDVAMAIELAQLDTDIAAWPQGRETMVGARGIRLSTGQKQRTALARALAGRPSILLLDDCTASLDAETEAAVWKDLFRILPGCTALVVTHRPATLERAGRIVLLQAGRVCESGSLRELEREGTRFHELYMQWKLRDEVES